MYMSTGLSAAKRRRGIVHEKPTHIKQKEIHEPNRIPTPNELLLAHEVCIRQMHTQLQQLESEVSSLKTKSESEVSALKTKSESN